MGARSCDLGMQGRTEMATETIDAKADRLEVQIKFCTEHVVSAAVRGDTGVHDVRSTRNEGWRCSCPCHRRCSHVAAVAKVTMRPVKA